MADTGIPTVSIPNYGGDTASTYKFLDGVIPQEQAAADQQARTNIAQQSQNLAALTEQHNNQQMQQHFELAQQQTQQQMRITDALFPAQKMEQEAKAKMAIYNSEMAQNALGQQTGNNAVFSQMVPWMNTSHPEDVTLGKTDPIFNNFVSQLKGVDSINQAQGMYAALKQKAFALSQNALVGKWDSTIGTKILDGWTNKDPSQREFLVNTGNARQDELNAVTTVKGYNAQIAPTADTSLLVDPEKFSMGKDTFGIPMYNVNAMNAALATTKGTYDGQAQVVGSAQHKKDSIIAGQLTSREQDLASNIRQTDALQNTITKLTVARDPSTGGGANDGLLQEAMAAKGVNPDLLKQANSSDLQVRNDARTKLYNSLADKYQKELADNLAENKRLKLLNPRQDAADLIGDLRSTNSAARSWQARRDAGDTSEATLQTLNEMNANLEKARAKFDKWYGEPDGSTYFDGSTYKVNPDGFHPLSPYVNPPQPAPQQAAPQTPAPASAQTTRRTTRPVSSAPTASANPAVQPPQDATAGTNDYLRSLRFPSDLSIGPDPNAGGVDARLPGLEPAINSLAPLATGVGNLFKHGQWSN